MIRKWDILEFLWHCGSMKQSLNLLLQTAVLVRRRRTGRDWEGRPGREWAGHFPVGQRRVRQRDGPGPADRLSVLGGQGVPQAGECSVGRYR
jgi:hypothetical protein